MAHFVCILSDAQNRPLEIRVINANDDVKFAAIAGQPCASADEAATFQALLQQLHNLPTPSPRAAGKRKHVKCWQTGEIFWSASAAARAFGVSTSAITQHLRNPSRHSHIRNTFTFEVVE